MTAEEARKLNDEYLQTLQLGNTAIDEAIKQAAKKGKKSVYVNLQDIEYALRDDAFDNVKRVYSVAPKNFNVKRQTYSGDMREPGSDGVVISW